MRPLRGITLAITAFLTVTGALTLLPAGALRAADGDEAVRERLQALEQEVALLKRQLEVKSEADSARQRDAAVVGAGRDGFFIASPDRKYQTRLRGYAQLDGRFGGHPDERSADAFSLRRIRLDFQGNLGDAVDFRIMPDFGGSTFQLFDAYVNLKGSPQAALQFGKFKPPIGLERLQSAANLAFVERGFPTLLVPSRDIGVQFWGDVREGRLSYQLGVFNGVRDGQNGGDSDTEDGKDVVGRVFVQPFANSSFGALRGLGIGFAGSVGDVTNQAPASYGIQGAQFIAGAAAQPSLFFSYLAGTSADGGRVRIAPQGYWYCGPLGALFEYVQSQQRLVRSGDDVVATNEAWQVALSWVLSGENASYSGVTPRSGIGEGGWGALELALRVHGIQFDGDLFPAFANPDLAVRSALGFTAGLNWYMNRNLKLSVNYDHVYYDGGRSGGRDRQSDHQVLTRVQFKY